MSQQQASVRNGGSGSTRDGWTGLVNSLIGFTNAATMFTIQQLQNSVAFWTDSREMVDRFKRAIDSLSEAMNKEVDQPKRSTVEQMNRAGARVLNATVETMTPGGGFRNEPEEAMSGRKR